MSRFESITIREVESSDLETFYEHQLDREAIWPPPAPTTPSWPAPTPHYECPGDRPSPPRTPGRPSSPPEPRRSRREWLAAEKPSKPLDLI